MSSCRAKGLTPSLSGGECWVWGFSSGSSVRASSVHQGGCCVDPTANPGRVQELKINHPESSHYTDWAIQGYRSTIKGTTLKKILSIKLIIKVSRKIKAQFCLRKLIYSYDIDL